MKKVIFISALAIAAAVSCTKSDIVDTKFDEEISFQSYLGRTAQTKAEEITTANVGHVYVYGYYTGAQDWDGAMTANLWNPMDLTVATDGKGTVTEKKYWANADDKYTFLAYAPAAETPAEGTTPTNPLTVAVTENGPTLTYKVPTDIPSQIDLLYATPQVNRTKDTWGENKNLNGVVALGMNHALSRVTVKAKDVETTDLFKFDVKEITLSGNFYTSGNIVLAKGEWSGQAAAQTTYLFHRNGTVSGETFTPAKYVDGNELPSGTADHKNYAVRGEKTDNYLMMIPTDADATLTVKYTTIYAGSESNLITKSFTITDSFVEGNAYAFQLDFTNDAKEITFTVAVTPWSETTVQTGNPENSTNWK